MWIQCDKPISGVVHGLKCTTKTKYRHILRSLKSKRNKYIKQSIWQRVLRNNNKVYWNEIRKMRKSTIQFPSIIDDCDDNTHIVGLFKTTYSDLYNSVSTHNHLYTQAAKLHTRICTGWAEFTNAITIAIQ